MVKRHIRIRHGVFASLLCAFALALPVRAENPPENVTDFEASQPPASKLVIFAGSQVSVDWFGSGPVEFAAPLCIGTSTGSYRLSVLPSSGLAALAARTSINVTLEQDGVPLSAQAFDASSALIFTGRTGSSDANCTGGQNARLVFTLTEAALTSALAGQYFDQIVLHLEAI